MNHKVLIADDTETNRILMVELFGLFEIGVDCVQNGMLAYERIVHGSYDLILMDIQMPVMDGIESMKKIKVSGCKTPVVALTGNVSEEERAAYLADGFDECLFKPVDMARLTELLYHYGLLNNSETHVKLAELAGFQRPENEQLLDMKYLQASLMLDEVTLVRILHSFSKSLNTQVKKLESAVRDNHMQQIAATLHALKGMSGNLKILPLESLLAQMETAGDLREHAVSVTLLKRLRELADKLEQEISLLPTG